MSEDGKKGFIRLINGVWHTRVRIEDSFSVMRYSEVESRGLLNE